MGPKDIDNHEKLPKHEPQERLWSEWVKDVWQNIEKPFRRMYEDWQKHNEKKHKVDIEVEKTMQLFKDHPAFDNPKLRTAIWLVESSHYDKEKNKEKRNETDKAVEQARIATKETAAARHDVATTKNLSAEMGKLTPSATPPRVLPGGAPVVAKR